MAVAAVAVVLAAVVLAAAAAGGGDGGGAGSGAFYSPGKFVGTLPGRHFFDDRIRTEEGGNPILSLSGKPSPTSLNLVK